MADVKKEILLESGTNELEILEFVVGETSFGINVAKVVEILKYEKVTHVPSTHNAIEGIFKPRDIVITIVDLAKYMNLPASNDPTKDNFIITNFNKITSGFHVHHVVGIHRISWQNIEKPDPTLYGGVDGLATGIAKFDNRLIVILDFEKLLVDINPMTGIKLSEIDSLGARGRNEKPILIAEDSMLLSKMILQALTQAGYVNVTCVTNGEEAWDKIKYYLHHSEKPIHSQIACLLTDIEMPKMDGHRLIKLVRDEPTLEDLPVIIFSSLINDEMRRKGEALGATAQLSKPEIGNLVKTIDKLIL
jgi:two-component system chemotaxis response regulator CheV